MKLILLLLMLFCIGYYIICASYAGLGSSFIFVWVLLAIFIGVVLAVNIMENKEIIKINPIIRYTFRGIVAVGIIIFVMLEYLIISNMNYRPDENCKYIIVLGCQIRGKRITKSLKKRLDKAYEYADFNKNVKIIVSGGQGKGEDMSEAKAMYDYLIAKGISNERIIMEDESFDTNQNMQYSAKIIENKNDKVGIVTSNFHVYRAKCLARAQGMNNICGIAADSDHVLTLNYMVREAVGILKDFLFGNFKVKQ